MPYAAWFCFPTVQCCTYAALIQISWLLQVDLQDKLFADARARNASMHLLGSNDLGPSAELPPVDTSALDASAPQGVPEDDT